jgi:O-antigen ligase
MAIATVGLGLLVGVVFRDALEPRVARTLAVLEQRDAEGLDVALSWRLSIWSKAMAMYAAHPVNGVGVDNFQSTYRAMADADDRLIVGGQPGAFHAHQIVLEILTETGTLGLLLWLSGVAMAWRAWRFADAAARQRARPALVALVVTVFPLNTHLAFYSTFWGGVTLLLAALFAGSLFARGDE